MGKLPASPVPFKKTCPCTILPPSFLIFQISLPPGKVVKIYSPSPIKKEGVLNYVIDYLPLLSRSFNIWVKFWVVSLNKAVLFTKASTSLLESVRLKSTSLMFFLFMTSVPYDWFRLSYKLLFGGLISSYYDVKSNQSLVMFI